MRIRVVRKPAIPSIDGVRLDKFEPGRCYEVGTTLGTLFLAEDWAEPVLDEKPALVIPLDEIKHHARRRSTPSDLQREPSARSRHVAIAADMNARKRRSRTPRTPH